MLKLGKNKKKKKSTRATLKKIILPVGNKSAQLPQKNIWPGEGPKSLQLVASHSHGTKLPRCGARDVPGQDKQKKSPFLNDASLFFALS